MIRSLGLLRPRLPGLAWRRSPAAAPIDAIDFARLVGPAGWQRLPEAVRRRFAPHAGDETRYVGTMRAVACSGLGLLLAQLCRPIGNPFAPWPGRNVPVTITLRRDPATGGIAWEREYRFRDHPAVRVRSVKRSD